MNPRFAAKHSLHLFALIFWILIFTTENVWCRKTVSKFKVIDDTEAIVGKLFNFSLPKDAFRHDASYLNVIAFIQYQHLPFFH